jgi:acid phosphatase (class A)
MAKRIALFFLLLTLITAGLSPVEAKKDHKGTPLFDLTLFLAPPPAQDSDQTKAELAEILKVQKSRTPEMMAAAVADTEETGFSFANVMGSDFTAAKLPLTAALLGKVHEAEGDLTDPVKDYYHRPRPYDFDSRVEPCVKKSKSFSYPSGHATGGTAMAVILAHLVPEKKDAILARGLSYAENRIVGGAHYRSDIVAGQRAGVLLAEALLRKSDFKKDYEKARAELREVLGLKLRGKGS